MQHIWAQTSPHLHHLGRTKCDKTHVKFASKLSAFLKSIGALFPPSTILVFVAFWLSCNAHCSVAGAGHACCFRSASPTPYIFTVCFISLMLSLISLSSVLLWIETLSFRESRQTSFLPSFQVLPPHCWRHLSLQHHWLGIRVCASTRGELWSLFSNSSLWRISCKGWRYLPARQDFGLRSSNSSGFGDVATLAEVKEHRSFLQASLEVLPGVDIRVSLWTSARFPEQLQEWEEDWDCGARRWETSVSPHYQHSLHGCPLFSYRRELILGVTWQNQSLCLKE